jgi:hypothetical protein
MKKMMRNPYEYHHDLGQFHFYVPICFAMWIQLQLPFLYDYHYKHNTWYVDILLDGHTCKITLHWQ